MLLLIEFRVEIKLYPICHIQPDNTALHRAAGHGRLDAEAETATVQLLLGTVWERREKRERMKEKDGYNKKKLKAVTTSGRIGIAEADISN